MFLRRRDEVGVVVGYLFVLWEICWCCGRFVGVVGDLLVLWEIRCCCGRFVGVVGDLLLLWEIYWNDKRKYNLFAQRRHCSGLGWDLRKFSLKHYSNFKGIDSTFS